MLAIAAGNTKNRAGINTWLIKNTLIKIEICLFTLGFGPNSSVLLIMERLLEVCEPLKF